MTTPDYPQLALGSYETYQLAHIATYIAERLSRHRASGRGRPGRLARAGAVRDLAAGSVALNRVVGPTGVTSCPLPSPLDMATYTAALKIIKDRPEGAEVVSLAGIGRPEWAVLGHVPGIGPVGAAVGTWEVAEGLRKHFLTRPTEDLIPWRVTEDQLRVPKLPHRVDLPAFVEHLDPGREDDRAVARALRGTGPQVDAAIHGRFRNVDLDAPFPVRPWMPHRTLPPRATPAQWARAEDGSWPRAAHRPGVQRPAAAPRGPNTSAGP